MEDKQFQIVRMNSLTNSVNLIKELTPEPSVVEVVRLATMFTSFVVDGKLPSEQLKKVDTYFRNKKVNGTTNGNIGSEIG